MTTESAPDGGSDADSGETDRHPRDHRWAEWDEELVAVPLESVVRALSRLLSITHPYHAHDAWVTGMGLLLNLDEDEALAALGWARRQHGEAVETIAAEGWNIDAADIVNPMACSDCSIDVGHTDEYDYIVKDEVWAAAAATVDMLCIGCLEKRLGRTLTRSDFDEAVLMNHDAYPHSARLRARLTG